MTSRLKTKIPIGWYVCQTYQPIGILVKINRNRWLSIISSDAQRLKTKSLVLSVWGGEIMIQIWFRHFFSAKMGAIFRRKITLWPKYAFHEFAGSHLEKVLRVSKYNFPMDDFGWILCGVIHVKHHVKHHAWNKNRIPMENVRVLRKFYWPTPSCILVVISGSSCMSCRYFKTLCWCFPWQCSYII
jgi:hypothetical protein